jgi:uncharacterized membrane protein
MNKSILIIILSITILINSCTKDQTASPVAIDCTQVSAKFSADIAPILNSSKCSSSGCHPGAGTISTHSQIMNHVTAGHFDNYVINRTGKPMPPNGSTQLTADELNKIKCWKQNGYPNN